MSDWTFMEDDDDEDDFDLAGSRCPQCGERVPESHLETDTGVCISCEDMNMADEFEE